MTDFGTRLKDLRKSRGWSQKTLGDKLGMHKNVISYYELGQRLPDVEALVSMAHLFHVSVDYLLGEDSSLMQPVGGLSEAQRLIVSTLVTELCNKPATRIKKLTQGQQDVLNSIISDFFAERE